MTQVLNITQTVYIGKWDWLICCAGSVITICPGFSGAQELQSYARYSSIFGTNKWAYVTHSDPSTHYCLDCLEWQQGLANMQWSIGHDNICPGFHGAPELRCYACKRCGLATHQQAMSYILTQILNSAEIVLVANGIGKYDVMDFSYCDLRHILRTLWCTRTSIICQQLFWLCHQYASHISYSDYSTQYCIGTLIAKWDWEICCAVSAIMGLKIYTEDCPVHLNFDHRPANTVALPWIYQLISRIQTQLPNTALTDYNI